MEQSTILPLNLQFFAEDAPDGAQDGDTAEETQETTSAPTQEENSTNKPAKPLTLAQMMQKDADLQRQFDKMFEKGLGTARSKWEAEKNMTAEQLAEQKAQEKASALAEREKALALRELQATARGVLAEKGMSVRLVKGLDYSSEENMLAHIDELEADWRTDLERARKADHAGTPPKAGGSPATAQIAAMRAAAGLK